MVAFRTALWWMMGIDYHFNAPDGSPILYEFRKDLSAYVELVFILFLVQWLVARYAAPPAASSERRTLAIGDGSVTHHLPIDEIEHVAEIGRASCRARVCQYGLISGVPVDFKKKTQGYRY